MTRCVPKLAEKTEQSRTGASNQLVWVDMEF